MKPTSWHIFIAEKLKVKCDKKYNNTIKRMEIMNVFWRHNIGKDMRNTFLKEMEDMKLVKRKDRLNYKVLI